MKRLLAALLLVASPVLAQAENGWVEIENGWGEMQTPPGTYATLPAPSGCASTEVAYFLGTPPYMACMDQVYWTAATRSLDVTDGRVQAANLTAIPLATPAGITVTPVLSQIGAITVVAGASLADGDALSVGDGTGIVPIEFDASPGDGTTGGAIPIIFDGTETATAIRDAVKAILDAAGRDWTTSNQGADGIGLVRATPGATGGAITEAVTNAGFTVTNWTDPTHATTVTYQLVACLADGSCTQAGVDSTTAQATATLNTTNYLSLSWSAVPGAATYKVYRKVAPTSPATTGVIYTGPAITVLDTGLAGAGVAAPTSNGTGVVTGKSLTLDGGSLVYDPVANVLDATKAPGALFDDDAGTFVHVVWRNGALVDLAGNTWTKVGSPTQVAASSAAPAGASAFAGATTRYDLASAISGSTWGIFAGCAAVRPTAGDIATTTMIASLAKNDDGSVLYELVANETGSLRFFGSGPAADAQLVPGEINIICFGVDTSIGRTWLKSNMRPIVTIPGGGAVTTSIVKLGSHFDDTLGLSGVIYELFLTTSIPGGDAAAWYGPELLDWGFAEWTRKAFGRLGKPVEGSVRPVYQATVAINASAASRHEIVATDNVAFSVAAPSGVVASGQRLTIKIKNTSGGALGTATWNSVYKMVAWTQPADGYSRSIDFLFDGTNWVETNRSAADVPN